MMVQEVKEFVLTETPCHLFKEALKKIEMDKKSGFQVISAPPERAPGTFPDKLLHKIRVKFGSKQNLF